MLSLLWCIRLRGLCFRCLWCMEYPFIVITSRSNLTQSGNTCLSHLGFKWILPCWWSLEYSDCITFKRVTPKKKDPVYDTKLNSLMKLLFWRVWSTPSLALLPGPLSTRMVVPVWVPSLGQIDQFQNYLYLIRLCAQKNINNHTKNIWMYNEQNSLNSWHKITLDRLTWCYDTLYMKYTIFFFFR